MPKSKETLNRRFFRLLDFGDQLLWGLTGGKSSTGGLISQSGSSQWDIPELLLHHVWEAHAKNADSGIVMVDGGLTFLFFLFEKNTFKNQT